MDQAVIEKYAKLILAISRGVSEADQNAQATCKDITGKVKSGEDVIALQKIASTMRKCNILTTTDDNEKIYMAIKALI